jgi:predicted metal-binding membrane protein
VSVRERHPEWLLLVVAVAAWIVLTPLTAHPMGPLEHGGHHGTLAGSAMEGFGSALAVWLLMVLAMMLPTTVPMVRYLGFGTEPARRQRSIGLFALGYVALWSLPGLPLALLSSAVGVLSGWPLAALVALAALWELTPLKLRALRGCCRTWPVRYTGPAADRAARQFGVRHAVPCLVSSGPAMAVLMLAGHPWPATVLLTALMMAQKLLSRPERWRVGVTLGGLATAALVLVIGNH